jgi:hypothetical protein
MEKLSIFFTAVLLVFFASAVSFAQENKTEFCDEFEESFELPCVDEFAYGTIEHCLSVWDGKIQVKVRGTMVGETSGKVYTVWGIQNQMRSNYKPGRALTANWIANYVIECEGIAIGVMKLRYHITINAKGEVVSYKSEYGEWECL